MYEGDDLVLFLSVICHTPIPEALTLPFTTAVRLQNRFVKIVEDVFAAFGTKADAKSLLKVMHFLPPPEEWVALKEAQP